MDTLKKLAMKLVVLNFFTFTMEVNTMKPDQTALRLTLSLFMCNIVRELKSIVLF